MRPEPTHPPSSDAQARLPSRRPAPDVARFLAPRLRQRRYARGEVIFHQGDPGGSLYLICSGRVGISITSPAGREHSVAVLSPGECFGEMSLLQGGERSATATALAPTETLVLDRAAFSGFLRGNPEAARQLASILARRLGETNQLFRDMLFLDVPARIARGLLRLAAAQGSPGPQPGVVVIAANQEQLARAIGASRETVNRGLRRYRRRGILVTARGRITITDMGALEEAAAAPA